MDKNAPCSGNCPVAGEDYVYDSQYDIVIIGSGAGGGAALHRLAHDPKLADKRIAVLEKGPWLPKESQNAQVEQINERGRYHRSAMWKGKGGWFQPAINYGVGGNTKYYAACLFRFRESDFEERAYADGISPAWPISYEDLRDYYQQAETLFQVRGNRGEDFTEPPETRPYPHRALRHEPVIQETHDRMEAAGWRPFHLPMGVRSNDKPELFDPQSPCFRCSTCGGHPCRVDGKSDSEVLCVRPAMRNPNVEILADHSVIHFETNTAGNRVTGAVVENGHGRVLIRANTFILAAGAANSAAIMLRSKSVAHPTGLANANALVGANYMFHLHSMVMLVDGDLPQMTFPKTLGFNDFYDSAPGVPLKKAPAGTIQIVGPMDAAKMAGFVTDQAFANALMRSALKGVGANNLSFIVSSEDLPLKSNRISVESNRKGEYLRMRYKKTNRSAHNRLTRLFRNDLAKAMRSLKPMDDNHFGFGLGVANGIEIPGSGNAHQCGTLGMGHSAATSVCDRDCRVWGVDNLYVADASVFTSAGAVNPALTIIANGLRVGDIVAQRV